MRKLAFLLLCIGCVFASQAITVKGLVLDEDGEPVIGATVLEVGKPTNGTATDVDGAFSLNVPAEATLQVSYVGYDTQHIKVDGRTEITVKLVSRAQALDDVVVVAFGQMKKEAFVGSAATMGSDELAKAQVTNAAQALAGRVPGLQLNNASYNMGESPQLTIRGVGSISSSNEPLYVVDGMPYDGSLNLINPQDIESITVLKDASSNALYGARGANGVVMITTKKGSGKARVTIDAKWGSNESALVRYNTLNTQQWFENWYRGNYNGMIGKEYEDANGATQAWTADALHSYLNENLMNNSFGSGYPIYTVPNGQNLIMPDGSMNPNATLGALYSYQGTQLWLQPDDWAKEGLKKGFRQEYNVTVSGGSNGLNAYLSLGYLDNEGIIDGSWEKRLTGRLKVDYQATSWLRVGANFNYSNYKFANVSESIVGTFNSGNHDIGIGSIWEIIRTQAPVYPVYLRDANRQIIIDQWGLPTYDFGDKYGLSRGGSSQPSNAIFSNKYRDNSNNGNSLQSNGYLDIKIIDGLTVTINGSTFLYDRKATYTSSPFVDHYTNSSDNGSLSITKYSTRSYNLQQLINFNRQFGKNGVEILLGHEYYKYMYNYLSGSGWNFGIDPTTELGTLLNRNLPGSYSETYNNEGWFARGIYNYDSRYYVNASIRRDASSRFAKNHRWGTFWSAGVAWVISNEAFFNADWVNTLKIKASVGSQGNDNIGDYLYADQYAVVNNNDQPAFQFQKKGTENITWETNTNWNVGVEFELFNRRLNGSLDYFYRKTSDMLFAVSTPPSIGYTSYYANIGDMRNAGFDFVIDATPIVTRDFTWTVNFNIAYAKNKVLKLPDQVKTQTFEGGHMGYVNQDPAFAKLYNFAIAEGLPLYSWYLRKSAGVDPNTGAALYWKNTLDANGNVIGQETTEDFNQADYYLQGDAMAPWTGGFGTSFTFYGFDLSVNLNFQLGGLVYDSNYQSLMGGVSTNMSGNWHKDILNSWSETNKNSDIPRFQSQEQYSQNGWTDRFMARASYLNLQNINFGYTLPASLTKKWHIDKIRVYFSAENVAYAAARKGLDPRQSNFGITNPGGVSPTRTFSGGLQVTF